MKTRSLVIIAIIAIALLMASETLAQAGSLFPALTLIITSMSIILFGLLHKQM